MRKIFLISLLLLAACKKKQTTCSSAITDISANIAFSGFDKKDLDTLIVSKYTADDSFTTMISTETVVSPDVSEIGGFLYADTTGAAFTSISRNYDLKIYLVSTAKTFYLHAIYSPQTTETWTQDDAGCRSRTFLQESQGLIANGSNVSDTGGKMYYYYLRP
jgi:hypothetical protein